jgi:hypothetical protein
MSQKLAITDIQSVDEPEPAIVEITVTLADKSTAILRLNAFTLQKLAAAIQSHAASA